MPSNEAVSESCRSGAAEGTRTPDPIITNDVLYQLSYSGTPLRCAVIITVFRGCVAPFFTPRPER